MNVDGIVRDAIRQMYAGNYDRAIAIATRANTPEAQRLFREAIEREARETNERKTAWRKFVDDVLNNFLRVIYCNDR